MVGSWPWPPILGYGGSDFGNTLAYLYGNNYDRKKSLLQAAAFTSQNCFTTPEKLKINLRET